MSTSAVSIAATSPVGSFPAQIAVKARRVYAAATMDQSHGAKSLCIALTPQPADALFFIHSRHLPHTLQACLLSRTAPVTLPVSLLTKLSLTPQTGQNLSSPTWRGTLFGSVMNLLCTLIPHLGHSTVLLINHHPSACGYGLQCRA